MGWLKRMFLGDDGGSKSQGVGTDAPSSVANYEKTESGLQYCDLKVGDGAVAKKGDSVTVHYTGWLTNGKRFDSSVIKNKPFTFEVGGRRVIKGWAEGVADMKVGGIRQLRVPAALGYGVRGHPPRIPQNATLIFEIELLAVK